MIKLKSIGFATPSGMPILKNITATIEPHDFIMLVGQNGAGKTTLLNILAGSLLPSEGTICVGDDCNPILSAMVNRVHQNPLQGTIASLTVAQNIALYLYKNKRVSFAPACSLLDGAQGVAIIKKYFSEDILAKKVGSLSGGQRQLLSFLMATMNHLPLLLLDEPTAALDTQATFKMMQAVEQLHEQTNTALIMITHDPSLVHQYANKIWLVHQGQLVKVINQEQKSLMYREQITELMNGSTGAYNEDIIR